jgi:CDP-diacylglycerol---glycerol-3-phosphate 3-phosphatidyltransferase
MNLPNQLTVLRIILTPFFLLTLFSTSITVKYISFIIYIIASLTDTYDGYIAKKYGYVTQWGAFLDPLADKILVSAALIAFHLLGYIQLWMIVIIIIRDFLITGLRSYALFKNQPIITRKLAKFKTTLQMVSVFIVYIFLLIDQYALTHQVSIQAISYLKQINFINKLMLAVTILTAYTGITYFIENWNHIKIFINNCLRALKIQSD